MQIALEGKDLGLDVDVLTTNSQLQNELRTRY